MSNGSTSMPHDATPASAEKKVDQMYGLVEGIEIAMFTTRRPDGHLVSRPMATQARAAGADLWFVTDGDTHKMDELEHDAHVNVSYYRDKTREWVSVSGTARMVNDRARIHELYRPDWKAWFPDDGPGRDGGPDDPRLTLIAVDADTVVYMVSNTPRPVVLFEVVKGIITGQQPDVGETHVLNAGELHRGA
ncbi:MAG TPA: pyridoxamine 5'-phosphate oxidase family protein [Longimicrobium sp.]|jgi:general stress protein 26|uniref:pyridoxamine 5'-phosphate oxidase family protein n=1 Tax=Longimicrobium sp. TaxID=2029185 RepID=UPI002EDB36B3